MALLSRDQLQEIMLEKELVNPLERASFIHGFRTAEKIYTKGDEMKLKVKKLHPKAIIPTYGTSGAACFDLYALDDGSEKFGGLPIQFGEACTFRTGLSFEIPEGYVMHVYSRSGHGFKNGVRLANCVGVVDSDYTGEVMVRLANDGDDWFEVKHGDRIAQAMLIPVNQVTFEEVQELKETERGANGFGSTGA